MEKNPFELIEIETKKEQAALDNISAFLQNYQTALLLSLLEKSLLSQPQFDECMEELQKHKISG